MKYLLPLLFLAVISCKVKKDEGYYQSRIDAKIREIEAIIGDASSDDVSNCRSKFISDGDGCGPFYVYNINSVDSIKLYAKFQELNNLKKFHYNAQDVPAMCGVIIPDTLFIENGKCSAGL